MGVLATRQCHLGWLLSHLLWSGIAFHLGSLYGASFCAPCPEFSDSRHLAVTQESIRYGDFYTSLVPRNDFLQRVPLGLPRDQLAGRPGDVLVLHKSELHGRQQPIELMSQYCDHIKVVSLSPTQGGTCIAVLELQESSHVHYMQRKDDHWKRESRFPSDVSLSKPPKPVSTKEADDLLSRYMLNHARIATDLRPVASSVAAALPLPGTVVVMVCNNGHSELLLNFVCAANKIGFRLSSILLFATDKLIQKSAQDWGLTVFYHPDLLDFVPNNTGIEYGSKGYAKVMMSKVLCVHLISSLGFDFVFLDVDIVPYRADFLQHFMEYGKGQDLIFQYDHSEDPIYQPWSANSGFYFARNNQKTKYFFTSLLRQGDMILRSKSHQAVVNILLGEHVSLFGLKVRVLDGEASREFPVGYQFNKDRVYMKDLIRGDVQPFAFHMNWNNDKETKQKFNEQIGHWYLIPGCSSQVKCCSAEPVIVCHFKDKPSTIRCDESPFIEDASSFW